MSKRYAGNNLACASCHTDAGMRKFGNPLVGSYVSFPQYRGREDKIANIESYLNGCMERSMNGKKLPLDSEELLAMVTYLRFLSTDIPADANLEGKAHPSSKRWRARPTWLLENRSTQQSAWLAMATTAKAWRARQGGRRQRVPVPSGVGT